MEAGSSRDGCSRKLIQVETRLNGFRESFKIDWSDASGVSIDGWMAILASYLGLLGSGIPM